MENSLRCLLLKSIFLWTTVFLNCSIVTSSPTRSILLNSTENYDTQAAEWTFDFNFGLVSNISKSPVILRVMLELLDQELSDTSSLFAVRSKERFQHIRILGQNNSDQVNVAVNFDHAYSGHYKVKVEECRSQFSCFQTIHESDLGVVSTNLTNIDVARMNISIRTTTTEIGGIDVSFAVLYYNVSNAFLPFEEFLVSLISVDGIQSFSQRVIGETKAEFRPCSKLASNNESTSVNTDCYQFVNGQYITRIDPIDSRCNFQKQVNSSIKRPCSRHIFTNITVIPNRFRREGKIPLKDNSSLIEPIVNNSEATITYHKCSIGCQISNFILTILRVF